MTEEQIEAYLNQLRAMGYTEDVVEVYRQQLAQTLGMTEAMTEFNQNMNQFNEFFGGLLDDDDEEDDEFYEQQETDLTLAEQWGVACGANLAYRNGQPLNILASGLDKQSTRHLFSSWWDVDSREELLKTLNWLEAEGHRNDFEFILQLYSLYDMAEAKKYIRQNVSGDMDEETEIERLRHMRDAKEQFTQDGLFTADSSAPNMMIWDFGRMINLCRYGIDAGYLQPEEAMERINQAAEKIQKSYNSWAELGIGYIFGRFLWNGGKDYAEWRDEMQVLLTHPESPWTQLPWDTYLGVRH
ncbi:DUF1266 domain-containing protein [Zophobihabitans entericus]|uniref:DUF1266 domain-containing protein n=1 Tax=Zophobihabitans entericus TaxID=1635327 RepID=A0A6G9I9P8_9GAMM|nr:DUF1266 domain-containing protein [Zophobihabitans entericus]QIQ20454.1 DUF1266 domain-containing protein [Zophobihabitans entericus]